MNANLQQLLAFHLTGEKPSGSSMDVGKSLPRPALLSKYRDLSKLRYDYPLVLVDRGTDRFVASLSAVSNEALQKVAPKGIEGERLRKNVLGLESAMRVLVSNGKRGSLTQLWDLATESLLSKTGDNSEEKEILRSGLKRARAAVRHDGEVIDCDEDTPARLLTHAWNVVQKQRSQRVSGEIDELIIKLSDILKADFMKSDEARSPGALKPTIGKGYQDELDFEALSSILTKTFPADPLPEKRRERLRFALSALESQRFFAATNKGRHEKGFKQLHSFVFDSCAKALEAFHHRLAEMVTFVKAVRIAELEIQNKYKEAKHDRFFDKFAEDSLTTEDIGLFPSYLVCLSGKHHDDADKAKLIQVLSSGLPMKVLLKTDDALESSSVVMNGKCPFGGFDLRLASMAVSLQTAFVLQSTSSNLYQMMDSIRAGLEYPGPALFSVFAPSAANAPDLPLFLVSASAMQSRAFPAFTYDPSAGADWASRFSIAGNPQAEVLWPVDNFTYEDRDLQRISQEVAFTFIDFAACDKRCTGYFMRVPQEKWTEAMMPAKEYLDLKPEDAREKIPYVLIVDESDVLHKVVVSQRLIGAARRCAEMWRNLEELGGINNSHALRLLEKEKQAWEEKKKKEIEELKSKLQKEAGRPATEEAVVAKADEPRKEAAQPEQAGPIEDAYIETPRCTSCNECTNRNSKMFAYNENKQAHVKDINAGTYKDLVEAAEKCPVCIIHPGKPRNPDEPNLEDLIKRAEPFNQPPRARRAA
jgi:ferredoxin